MPGIASAPRPAEQAKRSADDTSDGDAGRRAFRRLSVLFVGEVACALLVLQQDGDSGVGEAEAEEMIDRVLGQIRRAIDTEDCDVFAGHGVTSACFCQAA